jgi:hypothetical protein
MQMLKIADRSAVSNQIFKQGHLYRFDCSVFGGVAKWECVSDRVNGCQRATGNEHSHIDADIL